MKKYAICGVSNRAMGMFLRPMLTTFRGGHKPVALLDSDPLRFQVCKQLYPELADLPEYGPDEFDRMVRETKPDIVIVASRDDTHAGYILRALEHGLDVFTEKPMATTAEDCRRILDAEKASKGKVTVTFNYRYNPIHTRIKEMILEGKIGRVVSVDLNWYIDTYHGASYFKRWNRMREFSGGLSIHKSSHHFDLVNWWTGQRPVEAFAYGALNFFGPDGRAQPEPQGRAALRDLRRALRLRLLPPLGDADGRCEREGRPYRRAAARGQIYGLQPGHVHLRFRNQDRRHVRGDRALRRRRDAQLFRAVLGAV